MESLLKRALSAAIMGVFGCVVALAVAPVASAYADEASVIELPPAAVSTAVSTDTPSAVAGDTTDAVVDEPAVDDEGMVGEEAPESASDLGDESTQPTAPFEGQVIDEIGSVPEAIGSFEPTMPAVGATEDVAIIVQEPIAEPAEESDEASVHDSEVFVASPVVADGQYVIRSVLSDRLVVSTTDNSTADGANAELGSYNREDTQIWVLTRQGDGTYTIGNEGTDYVLTVAALAPTPGTSVVMFHRNGNILQYWNIVDSSKGYEIISAADPSIRLEIAASPAEGVNIRIGKMSDSDLQRFYLVERFPTVAPGDAVIEEGAYLITPMHADGYAIQIEPGSYDVGTPTELWTENGDYEQKFYFDRDDEGYYVIANVHSGLVLDVRAADVLPRATVWQYEYNGTDAQRWAISVDPNHAGGYIFVNKATGTVLSVSDASTTPGAAVQTHLNASSPSRSFGLTRVSLVGEGVASVRAELNDGLVFDVPGCSRDDNTQLWIYEYNGTTAQKLYFRSVGLDEVTAELLVSGMLLGANGSQLVQTDTAVVWRTSMRPYDWRYGIEFVDTATGLAIECANRGYVNGTKLRLATPTGDRGQLFLVEHVSYVDDGLYVIHSAVGDDKVLELHDRKSGSGGNIDIWADYDIARQQFYIVNSGNGWYKIINAQTGLAIEAANSQNVNGVNVEQTEWFLGADRQLWSPEIGPDGYMYFINKATGMALDVANTVNADGTNVRMHAFNGQLAQKWYIRDTTLNLEYDPMVDDDVVARALARANSRSSSTDYIICVDLSECRVIVFYDHNGSWQLEQDFLCSPGAYSTPTVTGDYSVQSKGYSFGSGYTCYYYTQFYGNYLFHSVLYNQGTRVIQDGRLGQHLSHGCVRMDIDDAYWIYTTIPYGTRVSIYW